MAKLYFPGKIKVISDGTVKGTQIMDGEGKIIGGVQRLELIIDPRETLVVAKILFVPGIEVECQKVEVVPGEAKEYGEPEPAPKPSKGMLTEAE